jgi:hypothetical protein
MMKAVAVVLAVVLMVGAVAAQENAGQKPAPQASVPQVAETPAANPADVKSMDAILTALYDVISGPAGQKRDWNRFRSLFIPGARLIPTGARQQGGYGTRVMSPDDYAARADGFFAKEAFYEKEVARRVEQWAHIAQVFSTYESRRAPADKPFARGINSIQLMNDGQRWWIVTVFWQGEDKDNPLPEAMLSPGR